MTVQQQKHRIPYTNLNQKRYAEMNNLALTLPLHSRNIECVMKEKSSRNKLMGMTTIQVNMDLPYHQVTST